MPLTSRTIGHRIRVASAVMDAWALEPELPLAAFLLGGLLRGHDAARLTDDQIVEAARAFVEARTTGRTAPR